MQHWLKQDYLHVKRIELEMKENWYESIDIEAHEFAANILERIFANMRKEWNGTFESDIDFGLVIVHFILLLFDRMDCFC